MVVDKDTTDEQSSSAEHDIVAPEPGFEQLQADLEAVHKELTEANEKFLRAKAEAENMRRRASLDVENAHKYGIEKIARELLNVVDSLEKGMETVPGNAEQQVESMRQGIELTHKLLLSILEKFNIHQIDPIGAPFDPKLHEALTAQPTADVAPNTVLSVIQKGFVIHDRVLRPARVIVAKPLQ